MMWARLTLAKRLGLVGALVVLWGVGSMVTIWWSIDTRQRELTVQAGALQGTATLQGYAGVGSAQRDTAQASVTALSDAADGMKIIALTALALLLGGVLALGRLIARSITQPLARAAAVAEAMAVGNLDSVIDGAATHESGRLLVAMAKMQAVIKQFVAAQGEMKQQHAAGAISYRIDHQHFAGSYGEMARMSNELVASHMAVQTRLVEVVSQYARGELSVDMDKLPGEQAQLTAAIDGVKANLQALAAQICTLVDAAGRGDFTVRGEAAQFEYEFKHMVAGLNCLMQSADAGLSDVSRVLGALAQGDLSQKISSDYQGAFGRLKDHANQTVANLTAIVSQLKEASATLAAASHESARGNNDLSQRTEQQACALEETASSMEELTSAVQQNARNARQANQLVVRASDVAVKGGEVVKQVVATMSGISASSKKIADIIGVIDGLAFRTNILALNAAVEAARAGEQGRGFAVVATEVRNLAQRSATAAQEIKALISDSVDQVDAGTQLVGEAGKTMDEVVRSVRRVTDIMAEISAASQEQSSGIGQVNQAITQMDEMTQQNAALVEQAAAAAASTREQARSLVQAVSRFTLAPGPLYLAAVETAAATPAVATPAAPASAAAERRAPTRAINVARLPNAKARASTTTTTTTPLRRAAPTVSALRKAVGTEEGWQEC